MMRPHHWRGKNKHALWLQKAERFCQHLSMIFHMLEDLSTKHGVIRSVGQGNLGGRTQHVHSFFGGLNNIAAGIRRGIAEKRFVWFIAAADIEYGASAPLTDGGLQVPEQEFIYQIVWIGQTG